MGVAGGLDEHGRMHGQKPPRRAQHERLRVTECVGSGCGCAVRVWGVAACVFTGDSTPMPMPTVGDAGAPVHATHVQSELAAALGSARDAGEAQLARGAALEPVPHKLVGVVSFDSEDAQLVRGHFAGHGGALRAGVAGGSMCLNAESPGFRSRCGSDCFHPHRTPGIAWLTRG
jgi:hypothetical protein